MTHTSPALANLRRLLGDSAVDEWMSLHRIQSREADLRKRIDVLTTALAAAHDHLLMTDQTHTRTFRIVKGALDHEG